VIFRHQPCEDINFLLGKFQSDVANVTGVPLDMVQAVSHANESAQKTMSSGRLFTSKMTDLCRKLQTLLGEVYREIYGEAEVKFFLVPMSRLEINSVADLKILFDIGCLTPDTSLQLSSLLLGEELHNKKRRMQMMGGRDNGAVMDKASLKQFKQGEGKHPDHAKGETKTRVEKKETVSPSKQRHDSKASK
jgi:hypothetical protein